MKTKIICAFLAVGLIGAAQADSDPQAEADSQDAAAEETSTEAVEASGEETPDEAPEEPEETTEETSPILTLLADANADAGQRKYRRECRTCHGPKARGMASYPRLTQHPADYLIMRLEQYRAGEKIGPNTPLMAPRARRLSDQDIANLTAYITSLE